MSSRPALLLAAALALTSPSDEAIARWWRWGFSVGKSVNKVLIAPKSAPKTPTKPFEWQNTGTTTKPLYPGNSSTAGVLTRVWSATRTTLDFLAPKDDFMRNLYLLRAFSSWAQYLLFTPETLDSVAGVQYKTMMKNAQALPPTHPTSLRIKKITDRLINAVEFDPKIPQSIKQRMKWEVQVIASNTVNAFCLPGGKMAIYTGIIDQLHLTDDEIAVIMGHEITHALEDHWYKRLKESLALRGITAVAWATSGRYIGAFDLAWELWLLSNSRDHEREADKWWLDIVLRAGYDVCAWEKVWEKMGQASRWAPPEILSTHPRTTERRENLREQARRVWWKC